MQWIDNTSAEPGPLESKSEYNVPVGIVGRLDLCRNTLGKGKCRL